MTPIDTCKRILTKIMCDNEDFFSDGKTIFDYVSIEQVAFIRVHITDGSLPENIISQIAKFYKVC